MFADTLTLDRGSLKLTDEGYLHVNARVARIGIQDYAGYELGRPEVNTVKVYRDPAEVFEKDSLGSFASIPVTMDHPSQPVTADNWSELAKGSTGEEVLRDGEYLKIGLRISDAETIKAIEDGKRELSVGYGADLIWEAGLTADGESYDARQVGIRANHIAIVDRARAGPNARIGDDAPHKTKPKEIKDMTLKTVLVDGLSVETTDAGAQAIEKLQSDIQDGLQREEQLVKDDADALKAMEDRAVEAEAALKTLEDAQPTPEILEQMAINRAALLADAGKIAPDADFSGMNDAEIRRAAVEAAGYDLADSDDAEIRGQFKVLKKLADTAATTPDPVGKAQPVAIGDKAKAHKEFADRTSKAWETK